MTKVELAEHSAAWAERFASETAQIQDALGDLVVEIEHVGSTAVPGLAAKPTVDIAVGATRIDLPDEALEGMRTRGFEDAKDDSRPGERRFRKGPAFPREVIVHVVEWGGPMWESFLRFRDALRADPTLAAEYETLKRRLLEERGEWYSGEDKEELVARVLAASPARVELRSQSAAETERIAARLAGALRAGDVVTVSGELGSGKTTFVRGACRELGVEGPVTSPTFTVGHRYRGRVEVSHLDLFRFQGVSPAEWGDLEPYFDGALCFVEWPEAAGDQLPRPRARVELRHAGADRRLITLESADEGLLATVSEDAGPGV
ncbi:MAG TPA: tRNA (adenosine(37)-N6)-threonylcarbamoyltransferase complex ATPase subunit type 1 TsaE [Gaiellaceae bacterium]|nr:tRNA (adenosine(37)-N6)-threonylcarbamoyltransferase complex ATPase subunit type 1 TsaE [Gaiellaceae bacterium]